MARVVALDHGRRKAFIGIVAFGAMILRGERLAMAKESPQDQRIGHTEQGQVEH